MDGQNARRKLNKGQWTTMLRKAEKMLADVTEDKSFIPRLKRDASQLENATTMLRREAMEEDNAGNNIFLGHALDESGERGKGNSVKRMDFLTNRANRLLGQYNFDADKLERDLHQIVPRATQQAREEVAADHHVQVISTTIHEALMSSIAQTENQAIEELESEWEREKRNLLEELKRADLSESNSSDLVVTPAAGQLVVRATPTGFTPSLDDDVQSSLPHVTAANRRENSFYDKLRNSAGASTSSLASSFGTLSRECGDNLPSSAYLWKLVLNIVQSTSAKSMRSTNDWFVGARTFLEDQYKTNVILQNSSSVESFLKDVKARKSFYLAGGIADELRKYAPRSWQSQSEGWAGGGSLEDRLHQLGGDGDSISSRSSEPFTEGDLPLWAVVYYHIRSGGWKEAIDVMNTAKDLNSIGNDLKECLTALKQFYCDGDTTAMEKFRASLDRLEKQCVDISTLLTYSPWKRALLYMLLRKRHGRLFDRALNASVQDYMWMNLNILLTIPVSEIHTSNELLADLRNVLLKNGPQHFSDGNDPHLFARLLLMVQMPMEAIQFLSEISVMGKQSPYISDAVHVGLCVAAYVQENQQVELVNFVSRYVRRFFAMDRPKDALFYITYLAKLLPENNVQHAIVNSMVSILVSPGYCHVERLDSLLGDIDRNFRQKVLRGAGMKAASLGTEDAPFLAIEFYRHDGASIDQVLSIVNSHISKVLDPSSTGRRKWKQLVRDFDTTPVQTPTHLFRTFQILVQLLDFADCVKDRMWENALNRVSVILPLTMAQVDEALRNYYKLDDQVLEVFPNIFENAILVLQELFRKHTDDSLKLGELNNVFNAFQTFSATLPAPPQRISLAIARFQR